MSEAQPFTLREVFDVLSESQDPLSFACDNPHWWAGKNSAGHYTYDYYCCDMCGSYDHETVVTLDELRGRFDHKELDEREWRKVE